MIFTSYIYTQHAYWDADIQSVTVKYFIVSAHNWIRFLSSTDKPIVSWNKNLVSD